MSDSGYSLESFRPFLDAAVAHRRALHAIPEAGMDLPRTADYVEAELRRLGLSPRRVGCGMWADLGTAGPLVAVRADMDALPVQEATGATYASTRPGFMHACGHDAHTGALLGAAAFLAAEARAGRLGFRVRLVFQAGEEGFFGALPLIEAGVLEGVAAIVAGHVGDLSDELAPGEAGFLPGPMMAASDRFRGRLVGSGGHGSAPHHSPDPIAAFAEFVLALQTFRARELDQTRPAVVSVCAVNSGSTFNVIPGELEYLGTARSLHADIRATLERRIGETAAAVAGLRGLRSDFEWLGGYPPLVNHAGATELVEGAARALLPGRVRRLTRPIMGGEDFAYYLERVPGAFWFLNSQAPERGISFPNHNPRFDLDEARLLELMAVDVAGAAALAAAAARGALTAARPRD